MHSAETFTERALIYRRTKLLCPVHGVQPVASVSDSGLAALQCGCSRSQSIPLQEGKISVEQLAWFDSGEQKAAQHLFPATVASEATAQRRWWEAA